MASTLMESAPPGNFDVNSKDMVATEDLELRWDRRQRDVYGAIMEAETQRGMKLGPQNMLTLAA